MTGDTDAPLPGREFLASIQPIVLVGGRSTRFGRDKLLEALGDGTLVERPIRSLRAVFGPRVSLVGACDPRVVPLADGVIADAHPGIGPMGGIASALRAWGGPVFVLAGDMPGFGSDVVAELAREAERRPSADAVLASSPKPERCAGVYRPGALVVFDRLIARRNYRLSDAVASLDVVLVPVDPRACVNVNREEDVPTAL